MLNSEYLSMQIDCQSHAEHNIFAKIAPLMLKNTVLKLIYKHSLKGITATISNMGKVTLEPEYASAISSLDICMYTARYEFAVCSFEDILSIGCTTTHISSDIEKTFFRMFTDKNIDVEINSNIMEDTYR